MSLIIWFSQNDGNRAANAKHLIIVAGHSVAISGHLEDAGRDETDWYLLPYQKNRGLPAAIVGHINTGLNAANEDEQSLLIFSGGETRASTGPETEGASYYRVADAMNLWPEDSSVRARTISEEFATDSFENLWVSREWHVNMHQHKDIVWYAWPLLILYCLLAECFLSVVSKR